jgi:hypothetical protein
MIRNGPIMQCAQQHERSLILSVIAHPFKSHNVSRYPRVCRSILEIRLVFYGVRRTPE